jgi:UDP-N-acetylglucosamine/UDP-N-acetyl-alpha-D-glucosaminouronate 4-epimerase
MKRFLVTGGAGFIGSHITSALLKQGASVRILDDFSTGTPGNVAEAGTVAGAGRLELIEGDVADRAATADAVRDVDVIFHEAAFISVPQSMEKPDACFDVNVGGTQTLLEAARKAHVRRVIIASSAAVYGDTQSLPLVEETPARPLSPYASSKLISEMYADLYSRALGLEVICLRYFNVYGPRQRPDTPYAAAVPIFVRQMLDRKPVTIFGDGLQTRDLIYVGDIVAANLSAAEHPAAAGRVFNICTGTATRVLDLVQTLRELIADAPEPVFADRRAGDIYQSLGSPAKALSILGFSAHTTLRDGLKETVKWTR